MSTARTPQLSVSIETSGRCNLRCVHCYGECGVHQPRAEPGRNRQLLKELTELGGQVTVNFKGGEPFLEPDILDLLHEGAGRGVPLSLTTNGTLITEARAQAVAACGPAVKVYVSIDGPDDATNDPLRGAGTFRRIEQGIARLRHAGVAFSLASVVTAENAARMPDMARWAAQSGADLLQLVRFLPDGRGRELTHLHLSDAAFCSTARAVAEVLRPAATLFDEAAVFVARPDIRVRLLPAGLGHPFAPRMFTVCWNDEVIVAHMREKIGRWRRDHLVELIQSARQSSELRRDYLSWLRGTWASGRALRQALGLPADECPSPDAEADL